MAEQRRWNRIKFGVGAGLLLAGAGVVSVLAGRQTTAAPDPVAPAATVATGDLALAGDPVRITVYKSPTCGCCDAWVDHMREHGFEVATEDMYDVMPLKREHGLPLHLTSCHTTLVDGYVVEGHVPASVVRRLLAERPAVKGIAVPGMPMGSPGMEGFRTERYNVLTFDEAGRTTVYSSH
jgi:hypothetical protein